MRHHSRRHEPVQVGNPHRRTTLPLSVVELGPRNWDDFAKIAEKHGGVWGGCWCVQFHFKLGHPNKSPAERRALKRRLVQTGGTHAALVYDGKLVLGWCQFGSPTELPGRMTVYSRLGLNLPDWRITCFFVDRDRRGEGVATVALKGALRFIAAKGGGTVDAYPISVPDRKYSGSFLWGGTESMFTEVGFHRVGKTGARKFVMRTTVRPLSPRVSSKNLVAA
jgi:hypothetical protein